MQDLCSVCAEFACGKIKLKSSENPKENLPPKFLRIYKDFVCGFCRGILGWFR